MDNTDLKKKEYRCTSIEEFNQLLHVYGIAFEIASKTVEWVKMAGDEWLEQYNQRWEKYYNELYKVPTQRDGKPRYWFELLAQGDNRWEMIKLEPLGYVDITHARRYEILPKDIIERMAEALVDPDKVITMDNVRSTLLGKNMDIQYVYLTESCIVGTVLERSNTWTHWQGDIETAFLAYYVYYKTKTEKVLPFTLDFLNRVEAGKLSRDRRIRGARDTSYRKKLVPRPQKHEKAPVMDGHEPLLVTLKNEEWADIDANYIIRLAKIPEYNRWLWMKLEELKAGPLKKQIDAYKATKAYYRETLLQHRGKVDYIAKGKRPPYWFVITQYGSGANEATEFDPIPPAFESLDDLLPTEIRKRMFNTLENPAGVHSMTLDFPAPLNQRQEFQWLRYSPNCIMGKAFETEIDRMPVPGSYYFTPEYKERVEVELIHIRLKGHMYRDPTIAEAFIDEFMTKFVPTLG